MMFPTQMAKTPVHALVIFHPTSNLSLINFGPLRPVDNAAEITLPSCCSWPVSSLVLFYSPSSSNLRCQNWPAAKPQLRILQTFVKLQSRSIVCDVGFTFKALHSSVSLCASSHYLNPSPGWSPLSPSPVPDLMVSSLMPWMCRTTSSCAIMFTGVSALWWPCAWVEITWVGDCCPRWFPPCLILWRILILPFVSSDAPPSWDLLLD